jgi:Fuc2NAc and GlcNAc transferase
MGEYRLVLISSVLISFLTFVGTFLIRRFSAELKLIDLPNQRSSHKVPIPRGGGIAIAVVFMAATWALYWFGYLSPGLLSVFTVGGGAIAVVGILDDRGSLPAPTRFIVHLIAAILVIFEVGSIPFLFSGFFGIWLGCCISIVAVTWAINLFNFMDGIDGLAASEAIFIAGVGTWLNATHGGQAGVTAAFLYLATASFGFLIWNWPKGCIFLGDAGSGFLGFTLAALCLTSSLSTTIPVQAWLILCGVFLVDATVTLLRRVLRGDRWFEAHRQHAYQHLAQRWASHSLVTLLAWGLNIFWLLPWTLEAAHRPAYATGITVAALGPLVILVVIAGAGIQNNSSTMNQ